MESVAEDGESLVKSTGKTQRDFGLSVTIHLDSVIVWCYWEVVEPLGGKA